MFGRWNNSDLTCSADMYSIFLSFRSESPGQVFLFILAWLYLTLQRVPVHLWGNICLAYDNMCGLMRLKAAQTVLPLPPPFHSMWTSITKVIDTLHIRNHVNPTCQRELHPDKIGLVHPDLKDTKNTQAAEQTFIWLGRFKKIVCSMSRTHHLFYIHRMVKHRNIYTARCYKEGRKPLLA